MQDLLTPDTTAPVEALDQGFVDCRGQWQSLTTSRQETDPC